MGRQQEIIFHSDRSVGETSRITSQLHKQGIKIAVNGKLTSRSYETQDGQKRTVIEVVANQYGGIEF